MVVVITCDSHDQILWHYSSSHRLRNESSLNLELWLQEPVRKEQLISPNNSKNCSSTSQNNYDTDITVDKDVFFSCLRIELLGLTQKTLISTLMRVDHIILMILQYSAHLQFKLKLHL